MSGISNSATSSPGPLSFRCWRHGSHIWCPKTMKRQPPCWCSKVDFFFLCQGRNVTILTRAHTVLYGFKNFVQNSVFAFLNYIIGSLCIGQIQASTSPPGNPPGIWLFWKLFFKFPATRAKMPFKCPTLGSIQVIKCPHPEDISQARKWQKDGRNAKRLQMSNKIFINTASNSHSIYQKLRNTVSVFTTNKSLVQSGGKRCYKVTKCSAFLRVSCNIRSVL